MRIEHAAREVSAKERFASDGGAGSVAAVTRKSLSVFSFFYVLAAGLAFAVSPATPMTIVEQAPTRPAEGIQDNSFLIEEAYNQGPGVVQHILNILHGASRHTGAKNDDLSFVFTQEWPAFSQLHQVSYTVPYTFFDEGGRNDSGIEDISLNYRFQLLMESDTKPAFAPRFSLILPTGDADKDLGNDTLGYQLNLPVSKIVSDRWTVHGNAGATLFPDVDGHDLMSYNLGASVVYAVTPNFNVMLESVANWDEEVGDNGRTIREAAVVISPGLRYAFNHANDAQTVIGIAAPIGVTSAAPDISVFIYASFEHFFWRPRSVTAAK
jgi:hypothetical protein